MWSEVGGLAGLTPFRFTIPGASRVAPRTIAAVNLIDLAVLQNHNFRLTIELTSDGCDIVVVIIQMCDLEVLVVVRRV